MFSACTRLAIPGQRLPFVQYVVSLAVVHAVQAEAAQQLQVGEGSLEASGAGDVQARVGVCFFSIEDGVRDAWVASPGLSNGTAPLLTAPPCTQPVAFCCASSISLPSPAQLSST
jgi:hypothetical protein